MVIEVVRNPQTLATGAVCQRESGTEDRREIPFPYIRDEHKVFSRKNSPI